METLFEWRLWPGAFLKPKLNLILKKKFVQRPFNEWSFVKTKFQKSFWIPWGETQKSRTPFLKIMTGQWLLTV